MKSQILQLAANLLVLRRIQFNLPAAIICRTSTRLKTLRVPLLAGGIFLSLAVNAQPIRPEVLFNFTQGPNRPRLLERNADLSSATGWTNVIGGSNSPVSVTLSNSGNQFFRLRWP